MSLLFSAKSHIKWVHCRRSKGKSQRFSHWQLSVTNEKPLPLRKRPIGKQLMYYKHYLPLFMYRMCNTRVIPDIASSKHMWTRPNKPRYLLSLHSSANFKVKAGRYLKCLFLDTHILIITKETIYDLFVYGHCWTPVCVLSIIDKKCQKQKRQVRLTFTTGHSKTRFRQT